MKTLTTCICLSILLSLTACGSSPKKKIEHKELQSKSDARIELTKQYKECVIKAGGDSEKIKECDSYLDAIKKLQ